MEIDFLRHFHFTASQLEVLQKAYGPHLLPLQERVIEENHLLDGRSLLLCAPTSSGKTFLAEILFLSHVLKNRKVILLVPTKALASQRHEQLRQRYEPLGYEIVLSTRDHPFHDKRILEGRFHLAVMIYEKLEPLLRLSPALLAGVGACVIDEIHYLFDPNRGPDLEVLLTQLRDEASVQLLGLSAVVSDPAIARWLKADLLVERTRPVELRQGVLCGNRFTYTEFNTGHEGHETFSFDPPENEAELMRQTALYFAARGEITLLFWPRRDLCYTFARKLAETYEPDPDWNGAALEALEPTFLRDFLALLLPRRVAVHTSDLSQEERGVVESAIQKGEVVLICATGTLAEGINFPVINVLTTQRMYASNVDEKSQGRPPAALPIPQDRLFNMVGRAGRLGLSDFGRGMIVTQSPGDVDGLLGLYAAGQAPQFEPWLHRIDLATVILKLMGDCGYFTLEGCLERLHSTLSGQWNRFLGDLAEKTQSAIQTLLDECFLSEEAEGYFYTPLGELVMKSGLGTASARRLDAFVQEQLGASTQNMELLLQACLLPESREVYVYVPNPEIRSHAWTRHLRRAAEERNIDTQSFLFALLEKPQALRPAHHAAFKKVFLLDDWIEGMSIPQIEKRYGLYAGAIVRLATDAAWIVGCLLDAAAAYAQELPVLNRIQRLRESLLVGLPEEALDWSALIRDRVLTRREALQLVHLGYQSPTQVHEADRGPLQAILAPAVLNVILAAKKEPERRERLSSDYSLEIDPSLPDRMVLNGQEIRLTPIQYNLLCLLARHPGECVGYETILREVWNEYTGDKKQLSRQKNLIQGKVKRVLGKESPELIETIPSRGLVLRAVGSDSGRVGAKFGMKWAGAAPLQRFIR